jgi:hypothetical protein
VVHPAYRGCAVKAALFALVLAAVAPLHLTFAVLGQPVPFPARCLVLAAEAAASVLLTWLAGQAVRRSRRALWPRSGGAL